MYFNNNFDAEKAEFDAQRLSDATDIDAYIAAQADYAPRYGSNKSKGTSAKPTSGGVALPKWLLYGIEFIFNYHFSFVQFYLSLSQQT